MVWRKIDGTDYHFEVDGYQYRTWIDDDVDVRKIWHECYFDGEEVAMPFGFSNHSPYSYISKEEFAKFIDELKETE